MLGSIGECSALKRLFTKHSCFMFLYLGTCHQLGGGQGTLGGCSNDSVLKNCVLCNLSNVLGLQHQHGCSIGHRFGQIHQDILHNTLQSRKKRKTLNTKHLIRNFIHLLCTFLYHAHIKHNYGISIWIEQGKINDLYYRVLFAVQYSIQTKTFWLNNSSHSIFPWLQCVVDKLSSNS